jgi:hypothetical protein
LESVLALDSLLEDAALSFELELSLLVSAALLELSLLELSLLELSLLELEDSPPREPFFLLEP